MNKADASLRDGDPQQNPLATQPIGKLILKFALPAILSFVVNALYNIVDQIFIGQSVGLLGNAATNITFPLITLCTAIALLFGVGSASAVSLSLGAGERERATRTAANGLVLLALFGVLIAAAALIFLKPLMLAFGASEQVLPLAVAYTGAIAVGMPFSILSVGGYQLVRADGNPTYSMLGMTSGAILNIGLDALFIFVFNMGIAGAAWATVIGQALSCALLLGYIPRFKHIRLRKKDFVPRLQAVKEIASLGAAACFNQLAMMAVQISMNNILAHYGSLSPYGSDIPIACVGVVSKLNILLLGVSIGIAQGCQPINGFNYGAHNFARVRKTYCTAAVASTAISTVFFLLLQIFPREIVSIFGTGSEAYFEFSTKYLRIFMLMTFINGIQPVTSNFFTSIGQAKKGVWLSMTRQIIFLLPLILLFPLLWGIDGVLYAGPIADAAAAALAIVLVWRELRRMTRPDYVPSR